MLVMSISILFANLDVVTAVSNSIVLAKGGSKLETTTAQLARKSSVWPETLKLFHMYLSEIQHRYKKEQT
jgi:hypothetical protein